MPPTVIESCKTLNGKTKYKTLYKNTKQEPIVQTGIASEETRKNSPINMPSIHHSLDMESANKVGQNYYIPIT